MARHLFDWVSLDATSWRFAADHAEYFNLCDLSRENLKSNAIIGAEIANDCPCPYCGGLSFNQIKKVPFKKRVALLRGHNWWAVDKAFLDLYENSTCLMQLERFLKNRSKRRGKVDDLCSTLSLVEELKDVDIGLLQEIFAINFAKRKPSRARKQTVPA